MMSCVSVKNNCPFTVSVYIDEVPFFTDVLPDCRTHFKSLDFGSASIVVLNNREKVIFDLWLSVQKNARHTLEISKSGCVLSISVPS